jgi:hypothetical protein
MTWLRILWARLRHKEHFRVSFTSLADSENMTRQLTYREACELAQIYGGWVVYDPTETP